MALFGSVLLFIWKTLIQKLSNNFILFVLASFRFKKGFFEMTQTCFDLKLDPSL